MLDLDIARLCLLAHGDRGKGGTTVSIFSVPASGHVHCRLVCVVRIADLLRYS